jgi:hypothetical protein
LIGLQGAQQLDPIVKQKKHGKIAGQAVPAARFSLHAKTGHFSAEKSRTSCAVCA